MYSDGFNPRIAKICAWSGVVFCLMWLLSATVISGYQYVPPPSAALSAAQVVEQYQSKQLAIMIAVTLCNFSTVAYITWGVIVSLMLKKVEGEWPLLFNIQMVSLAVCVAVILYLAYFWAAASWRAGETLPEITQVMNDLGWLGVLYTGAPFAAYQIALGLATLSDKSDDPIFPRWSAYYNFFVSFFMFEAAGILFFKTGPFSQDGLFVFWLPIVFFFVWIVLFSWLAARAVDKEVSRREVTKINRVT
jgi:hypothetical protein